MAVYDWSPEREKLFDDLNATAKAAGAVLHCCPNCGCYMGKCHDEEDVDVFGDCPCPDMRDDYDEDDEE